MIENKYFVGSLLIKLETKTKYVCSQLLILQIAVANVIDVGDLVYVFAMLEKCWHTY